MLPLVDSTLCLAWQRHLIVDVDRNSQIVNTINGGPHRKGKKIVEPSIHVLLLPVDCIRREETS